MTDNNTVLLRVQLDEGKTTDRVKELTLDLEKNSEAQKKLKADRKEAAITEEEYISELVKLQQQQRAQRQEQTALTKNLDLYTKAVQGVGGSYVQSQAQLSLAQKQYQQLAGSAENSTEETQALAKIIDELRGTLKTTDEQQSAFFRNIGRYPEAAQQAAEANKGYGNSVVELKRKLADLTAARDLNEDKEAVQELNAAILETKGALQEATGKVDEFGERVQKNAKIEEIDTLSDAFGGVTAAIQLSTLASLDQEDADRATAQATMILAQAEAFRNLQIGIASAKDAGHIVFLKARNLLFTEGAVATATATAATAGQTAATVAQTTATGRATLAQRALNLAMTLNPIGLIVVAVGALVGAYYAWRGASDSTKKSVVDITEKVLRFGTPVGQVVTLIQYLYTKFQLVRDILDPVGRKLESLAAKLQPVREFFGNIADKVAEAGRSVGQYVGLLDTAVEKAAKASAVAVEQSEKEIKSAQLRARELELAGAKIERVRATEREALAKNVEALKDNNKQQNILNADELKQIDSKVANRERLDKKEQELYNSRREREDKLKEGQIALADFDLATADKVEARNKAAAAARTKELTEAKTNSEKAKKLAEQELKDQFTARKQLLENRQQQIARVLEVVEKGSADEQRLLKQQAANATAIQLADNSAAQVGVLKKQEGALLAARTEIAANGAAAQRKLDEQFATERINRAFALALKGNETLQAQAREGSNEELRLKQEAIALQLDQDIHAIDKREGLKDKEAEKARLRAVAARATAQLEYEDSLQNLQDYFADKEVALEQDYVAGRVSEKHYQDSLTALQKARVEAGKVLNRDYQKDTADLNREGEQLDAQATARYKAQLDKRIEAGREFGKEVGAIFAATLTEQGASLESFAGEVLILVLDLLEKQLQAQVAASVGTAVVGSLSSPQSIATAGTAGFAQAALLTAAITAAFGVAKSLIRQSMSAPSSAKFERGGVAYEPHGSIANGPAHSQGGIPLFSRHTGQRIGIEIEGGEVVMTKGVARTPHLLAAASAINVAAGGRPLVSDSFRSMPKLALGGVTPELIRQTIAGTGLEINYDLLAEATARALRKSPPVTRWSDFKAAEMRNSFTDTQASD